MSAVYALLAFFMTLAGGAFAFRYRRYLLYIMAFSAGLVIGVAFFDLMPEIVEISQNAKVDIRHFMIMVVVGFVAIFLLEKLTIIHSEKQHDAPGHEHHVGVVGAIGLSFHSFLDGLAIGVGFQAGTTIGVAVLLAVLAHDFADGLNTVTFMLAAKSSTWRTVSLLLVDAAAPVLGAALTNFIHLDARVIGFQLAFFAGFLLYLGASDLLPQVHSQPRAMLIVSTIAGLVMSGAVVYALESVT